MREFTKFDPIHWIRTVRPLENPDARYLSTYLRTCPARGVTGIFYLPITTMVFETRMRIGHVRKALAELESAEMIQIDHAAGLVWLKDVLASELGNRLRIGDPRITWIENELELIGNHPFVDEFRSKFEQICDRVEDDASAEKSETIEVSKSEKSARKRGPSIRNARTRIPRVGVEHRAMAEPPPNPLRSEIRDQRSQIRDHRSEIRDQKKKKTNTIPRIPLPGIRGIRPAGNSGSRIPNRQKAQSRSSRSGITGSNGRRRKNAEVARRCWTPSDES